jgi:hypothetical protein
VRKLVCVGDISFAERVELRTGNAIVGGAARERGRLAEALQAECVRAQVPTPG